MIINCHLSFFLSFSGDTLLVCGCFWLSQCFRAKLLCPIKNELKLSWKVRAEKAKISFGRCNTISLKCSTQTLSETTVKSKNQFMKLNLGLPIRRTRNSWWQQVYQSQLRSKFRPVKSSWSLQYLCNQRYKEGWTNLRKL